LPSPLVGREVETVFSEPPHWSPKVATCAMVGTVDLESVVVIAEPGVATVNESKVNPPVDDDFSVVE
jgi:hypothetical protein